MCGAETGSKLRRTLTCSLVAGLLWAGAFDAVASGDGHPAETSRRRATPDGRFPHLMLARQGARERLDHPD
jgi:hypothetical protein